MLTPSTMRLVHVRVQALLSVISCKLFLCAGPEPLHTVSALMEEESPVGPAQAVQHAEGTPDTAWGALQAFPDATHSMLPSAVLQPGHVQHQQAFVIGPMVKIIVHRLAISDFISKM